MQHNLRRLRELDNYEVASDDPDVRGWDVKTADGRAIGEVDELIVDPSARKVRYLEVELNRDEFGGRDDRRVSIPIESADIDRKDRAVRVTRLSRDAIASLPGFEYLTTARDTDDRPAANTLTDERQRAFDRDIVAPRGTHETPLDARPVQASDVVVNKRIETEHVSEPVTVVRERVRIERRPVEGNAVNRDVHMENGEIRIPITEEELVVEKRAVVKEELVVSKEIVQEEKRVEADLRKERFDVGNDGRGGDAERQRSRRGGV